MIIMQIATALAIGAYAVLSRDALYRHVDATPREWFMTAFSRSAMMNARGSLLKAFLKCRAGTLHSKCRAAKNHADSLPAAQLWIAMLPSSRSPASNPNSGPFGSAER